MSRKGKTEILDFKAKVVIELLEGNKTLKRWIEIYYQSVNNKCYNDRKNCNK